MVLFKKINLLINTTPALLLVLRPIGLALRGATPPHLLRNYFGEGTNCIPNSLAFRAKLFTARSVY